MLTLRLCTYWKQQSNIWTCICFGFGEEFWGSEVHAQERIDQDKLNLFLTICTLGAEVKSSV